MASGRLRAADVIEAAGAGARGFLETQRTGQAVQKGAAIFESLGPVGERVAELMRSDPMAFLRLSQQVGGANQLFDLIQVQLQARPAAPAFVNLRMPDGRIVHVQEGSAEFEQARQAGAVETGAAETAPLGVVDPETGRFLRTVLEGSPEMAEAIRRGLLVTRVTGEAAGEAGVTGRTVLPSEQEDFRNLEANTIGFVETALDMIEQVRGRPELLGTAGGLSRIFLGIDQQLQGIRRLMPDRGYEILGEPGERPRRVSEDELRSLAEREAQALLPGLGRLGAEAAVVQSRIVDLAFSAARAVANQEGRAVSDRDLREFLKVIGGGGALDNPEAMQAVLADVIRRVVRGFETRGRIVNRDLPERSRFPIPDLYTELPRLGELGITREGLQWVDQPSAGRPSFEQLEQRFRRHESGEQPLTEEELRELDRQLRGLDR
jgi:hypothetical protein